MSHITETDLANLTDSDLFVSPNNEATYTTKPYPLTKIEAAGEELKTLTAKHTIADFDHMGWQVLRNGCWVALRDENDETARYKSKYDTSSLIDAMQRHVKAQTAHGSVLATRAEGVRFYATLAN